MKRLSLKVKLTVLYTFFMVLVTCAALAILFSLSSREILSSAQSRLEHRVQESVDDLDYDEVPSLRLEARQKLKAVRPVSVGQASRISGVSPADISVLLVWLEQKKGRKG